MTIPSRNATAITMINGVCPVVMIQWTFTSLKLSTANAASSAAITAAAISLARSRRLIPRPDEGDDGESCIRGRNCPRESGQTTAGMRTRPLGAGGSPHLVTRTG